MSAEMFMSESPRMREVMLQQCSTTSVVVMKLSGWNGGLVMVKVVVV